MDSCETQDPARAAAMAAHSPDRNEAVVLGVLADRYKLPLERLAPGTLTVTESDHPRLPLRAFASHGGAVVAVAPEHAGAVLGLLGDAASVPAAVEAAARAIGGAAFSGVARTGVDVIAPVMPVTVLDTGDPRLPEWVGGHFTGEAWVVLGARGEVLSTAVLKRYDPRLREIAVGTAAQARGRGLARSVVAAAARHVLSEGRAVLYNHAADNHPSARVAESVGLHELGRYHLVVPDPDTSAEYGEEP